MAEVLAAHAEGLIGRPEAMQRLDMTAEERSRLTPLFQLAERLRQSMQPVRPSAAFVRSLGRELVDNARRQVALAKRLRRAAMIGAAALGSLVSIASVVGAIVFVVARLRARAQARALHAPTG
ncbi:MAG: hypothetical protein DRI79_09600 [Chloroflexi bacterium]|nr:MAG: hypothetical protein DRI80_13965 [Chloroflexota bacterium]RLC86750.1 MAG: hypothetical protein DRI79_09600 [Chloroflexota bacterium]